jgi:hypothetical protein
MRELILFMVAALLGLQSTLAQWGNEWNVGHYNRCHLKFNESGFSTTTKPITYINLIDRDNANICNEYGELIFKTNNNQVLDSNNKQIAGGNYLLDSIMADYFDGYNWSMNTLQGCIFLPKSNTSFYLFYLSVSDALWITGREQPNRLYYAIVDANADGGKGAVISKRNTLYSDTLCDGHLTAVRHGNGRDWWLVNNGYQNNVLHKYLVTPDTVLGPFFQAIGTPRLEPDAVGMACFSKDGSKYATGTGNSLINIFDFDRCSGMFSNPKTFQSITPSPWVNPYSNNSGCNGLCFSPNGRFLYINGIYALFQHDLKAEDIRASGVLLGKADSTYEWQMPFEASYISPNDKIILGTWGGGSTKMHVIEQPDSVGLTCDFRKCSLYLPKVNVAASIANMINYDLGALPGCDTFYTAVVSPSGGGWGRLFPNPAHTQLTIETNSAVEISIYDAIGKLVWQQTESHDNVNIEVQAWQAGLYVVILKTKDGVRAKKFLKE